MRFAPTRFRTARLFSNHSKITIASKLHQERGLYYVPSGKSIRVGRTHCSLELPAHHVKRDYVWPYTQTRTKRTSSGKGPNKDDLTNASPSQPSFHLTKVSELKRSSWRATSQTLATQVPPKREPSPNWTERVKQALKNGWTAVRKAKWLMIGFATVMASTYIAWILEFILHARRELRDKKPPFKLGVWLREQSTALPPGSKHWYLDSTFITSNLFAYREADWLRSPIFLIPHFTTHFSRLRTRIELLGCLIILLPYLRTCMSSRNIIVSFALGGFVSSNLCCAVERFTNPVARLTARELDLALDGLLEQQSPKPFHNRLIPVLKDWQEAHDKAIALQNQADERMEREPNADFDDLKLAHYNARQQMQACEDMAYIMKYTFPNFGPHHSISCLCKSSRIHIMMLPPCADTHSSQATIACFARPRSLSRLLLRSYVGLDLAIDVLALWLESRKITSQPQRSVIPAPNLDQNLVA